MYVRVKYETRNGTVVYEYHSARYGAPGQKREKKAKPTPEQMKKINRIMKERRCRLRLMEHFDVNDYFVTLTYKKENRPRDMTAAKEDFGKFIRKVRKKFKKAGYELKWIRNIECGTKGAWHVHLVINRIPDADLIIKGEWQHGKVMYQLMYEKGGFADLAAYLTKTEETDPRLRESSYSTSRNLPLPEPKKKVIKWKSFRKIRIPKGYYLDKKSCYEGINIFGYQYRSYTMLRYRRE